MSEILMAIPYIQQHYGTLHVIFEDLEYYAEESYCNATRMYHHCFGYLTKIVLD